MPDRRGAEGAAEETNDAKSTSDATADVGSNHSKVCQKSYLENLTIFFYKSFPFSSAAAAAAASAAAAAQNGGIQIVQTPPGPSSQHVVNQAPVAGAYPALPLKDLEAEDHMVKDTQLSITEPPMDNATAPAAE